MSQRTFQHGRFRVRTGWDSPLQHHFLFVDDGGDCVFSNLMRSNPAMTVAEIKAELERLNISSPPSLEDDLKQDQVDDAGSVLKDYGEV